MTLTLTQPIFYSMFNDFIIFLSNSGHFVMCKYAWLQRTYGERKYELINPIANRCIYRDKYVRIEIVRTTEFGDFGDLV